MMTVEKLVLRRAVTEAVLAAQKGDISACRAGRQICESVDRYAESVAAPLRKEIEDLNAEADRQDRLIRSLVPDRIRKPGLFGRLFHRSALADTVKLGA